MLIIKRTGDELTGTPHPCCTISLLFQVATLASCILITALFSICRRAVRQLFPPRSLPALHATFGYLTRVLNVLLKAASFFIQVKEFVSP